MTEAQIENQKEIIVSDLIDLFRRQSENWGDRYSGVLETLIRACIDLNIRHDDKTLVDIYNAVVEPDVLNDLLTRTEDRDPTPTHAN